MRRRALTGIIGLGLVTLGSFSLAARPWPAKKAAAGPSRSNLEVSLRVWNGQVQAQTVKTTGDAHAAVIIVTPAPSPTPAAAPDSSPSSVSTNVHTSSTNVNSVVNISQHNIQTSSGGSNSSTSSVNISVINE